MVSATAESGPSYGLMAAVAGAVFALVVGWLVLRRMLLDGGSRR